MGGYGLTSWKIVGFEKRVDWLSDKVPFNTKTIYLETSPPTENLMNVFFEGLNVGLDVGLMNQLPCATNAGQKMSSIYTKLDRYSLNPKHWKGKHKARVFKAALGYDGSQKNISHLTKQIYKKFDFRKLQPVEMTAHGQKYNQVMTITGPNGKTANIVTGWIKNKDNVIRITTTYVGDK